MTAIFPPFLKHVISWPERVLPASPLRCQTAVAATDRHPGTRTATSLAFSSIDGDLRVPDRRQMSETVGCFALCNCGMDGRFRGSGL
jgi:hypothetical protein